MIFVGKLELLELIFEGKYAKVLSALSEIRWEELVNGTGATMILGAVLYHVLPIGLVPSFIPFFGRLDRTFSKLVGIAGVAITYLANN